MILQIRDEEIIILVVYKLKRNACVLTLRDRLYRGAGRKRR